MMGKSGEASAGKQKSRPGFIKTWGGIVVVNRESKDSFVIMAAQLENFDVIICDSENQSVFIVDTSAPQSR